MCACIALCEAARTCNSPTGIPSLVQCFTGTQAETHTSIVSSGTVAHLNWPVAGGEDLDMRKRPFEGET